MLRMTESFLKGNFFFFWSNRVGVSFVFNLRVVNITFILNPYALHVIQIPSIAK